MEQESIKETKAKNETSHEARPKSEKLVAVIRVRGVTGIRKRISDTLNMLCLYRSNFCTVRKNTSSTMGMIKKVKDYVTYGEISDDVFEELKKIKKKDMDPKEKAKSAKMFFRLNPPKRGYGRKGIKKPFSRGGALGYRGDKINDLIKRML